jgi:hypothetical protein
LGAEVVGTGIDVCSTKTSALLEVVEELMTTSLLEVVEELMTTSLVEIVVEELLVLLVLELLLVVVGTGAT